MKQDDSVRDAAALLARGILGASIAAHGAQKLFGWFGGPGPTGTAGMMKQLGFDPPELYAQAASLNEIAAGVLIATGSLGPVGPALLLASMATAVETVHLKNGFWNSNQGFELNTMYALAALLLATGGYGRASVDNITGVRRLHSPLIGALAVAGGIAGGVFMSSRRNRKPPENPEMKQEWPRAAGETGTIGAPAENVIPDL